MDEFERDAFDLADEDGREDAPYWTLRRVVYWLIILLTLIAFLVYVLRPALTMLIPDPPPITLPDQQV